MTCNGHAAAVVRKARSARGGLQAVLMMQAARYRRDVHAQWIADPMPALLAFGKGRVGWWVGQAGPTDMCAPLRLQWWVEDLRIDQK